MGSIRRRRRHRNQKNDVSRSPVYSWHFIIEKRRRRDDARPTYKQGWWHRPLSLCSPLRRPDTKRICIFRHRCRKPRCQRILRFRDAFAHLCVLLLEVHVCLPRSLGQPAINDLFCFWFLTGFVQGYNGTACAAKRTQQEKANTIASQLQLWLFEWMKN